MQDTRKIRSKRAFRLSLHGDESGIALVYITIALPVIIGIALLAIDVGRFSALHSSLQHGADALALAGAAELDGTSTAISRSEAAMAQFVTNNTALFTSSAAATVTKSDVATCYLSTLPSNDSTEILSTSCLDKASSTDAKAAKYVQVKVNPKTYTTVFPATFLGALTNTTQTSAQAVAGFQAIACGFTPIFMCNPFEPTSGATETFNDYGLIAATSDPNQRKAAIRLIDLASAGTATAVPGQFGYLDPSTGSGTSALREEIAAVSPDGCFVLKDLATTNPGSRTTVVNAFNTRFDIYKAPFNSTADKRDYPSAMNVRKGRDNSGSSCPSGGPSILPDPDTNKFMAMPVDSCFKPGGSCATSIRGNGDWKWDPDLNVDVDFSKYWNTNFNWGPASAGLAAPSPNALGLGPSTTSYTGGTSGSGFDTPPRYDVYKYELAKTTSGTRKLYQEKSKGGETGSPICSTGTSTVDRRLLYGPVINCRAENLKPGNGGYRSFGIATFFIIRPMSEPPDPILWVELVNVARPGDTPNIVRDQVQLYR